VAAPDPAGIALPPNQATCFLGGVVLKSLLLRLSLSKKNRGRLKRKIRININKMLESLLLIKKQYNAKVSMS